MTYQKREPDAICKQFEHTLRCTCMQHPYTGLCSLEKSSPSHRTQFVPSEIRDCQNHRAFNRLSMPGGTKKEGKTEKYQAHLPFQNKWQIKREDPTLYASSFNTLKGALACNTPTQASAASKSRLLLLGLSQVERQGIEYAWGNELVWGMHY